MSLKIVFKEISYKKSYSKKFHLEISFKRLHLKIAFKKFYSKTFH